ncbi:hypothetical protein ILUMI_01818 [Ignelater luminosus]|uniref:CLIP domain-containing serine protease n=1 Tax=Ignelater luminosus TaxID=2038154 RepID=A0A8K0DPZ7_IGNLU|nr:hypothetical protein ILUMI_01818 [Ignelater luminosus]
MITRTDIAFLCGIFYAKPGCKKNEKKMVLHFLFKSEEPCTTPDNAPGECILLRECHSLREMIANKVDGATEFVRQSVCGYVDVDSLVCCVKKTNNKHLLANRKYCGYQHSDDYSHDTNSTAITEFPWLARLAFKWKRGFPPNIMYPCLGSLINNKYVLTSARCVSFQEIVLMEVRLGEYHIGNDTDCVLEDGIQECSDPVMDYTVNKTIIHPDYILDDSYRNDIALVRLNGEVQYSDYIRPICLPLPDTKFSNIGDAMTISGWDLEYAVGEEITIKKKILAELISNEDCGERLKSRDLKWYINITDTHLCTVSLENSDEDTCGGDYGGPVMVSHRLQWRQEGISLQPKVCGPHSIDVHTKVQKYLEWIEKNIEP